MKLIDKTAVVSEIETRYNECLKRAKIIDAEYWNGKADAYRNMLVVLDTLEVKETDLDEEVNVYMVNEMKFLSDEVGYDTLSTIAKHFYELGLEAQKGE